jgi:hypothetical protein
MSQRRSRRAVFRQAHLAGVHMTDSNRHRRVRAKPAPQGSVSNWVLVLLGAFAVAIATAAKTLL